MAHIKPHWNWPKREGMNVTIHVYSSGDEAELFVNGESKGRKRKTPGRKAFNGMALAIVRLSKGEKGKVIVKAESEGLESDDVEIEVGD